MNAETALDWRAEKVKTWLLALLRFSVTLEFDDEATVLGIADEMDRLGFVDRQPAFTFFLRTSTALCCAIADLEYPGRNELLRRHLGRIENVRLRHTFARRGSRTAQPREQGHSSRNAAVGYSRSFKVVEIGVCILRRVPGALPI
jgi:hypothetical protein